MMTYEAINLSDHPNLQGIADLEQEYGNTSDVMRALNVLRRNSGSRVIVAKDGDGNIIGHYVYADLSLWMLFRPGLFPLKWKLEEKNVPVADCTVPVFVHLNRDYDFFTNYLEFNNERIKDARARGKTHGVVGLNSSDNDDSTCYQQSWLQMQNDFAEFSGTTFESAGFSIDGKEIFIQTY